ncbi:MAG: hypothetical protein A2054_00155 [Deltaproteobacteria bacterium GWA2_55_10]|nr:MAG: hypothetical protein A2054_00155 [Deltaproteobacteria bacterium GWA2_55_10]
MKRISGIIAVLISLTCASPAAALECSILASPVTVVAYNDIQFSNYDGFVAAIDENREYVSTVKEEAPQTGYRNIHTFESFTAMLVDSYEPKAHNTQSTEEAFPAPSESYTSERYQAIMERSRFTALEDGGCGNIEVDLLSNPERAETGCI